MTKPKSLPPIDYLRQRLRYEPETGKLFWLDYDGMPKNWRARFAGKEALSSNSHGYVQVCIDYQKFQAHRLAWSLHFGEWPTDQIDHINGVRNDNRINNLRVVTSQENRRNASLSKANTSGITGVTWDIVNRKWFAKIMVNRRCINLGRFDSIEEAAAVRKQAAIKYGFTERHGTKVEEVE